MDVALRDVPWDQAFALILQTNRLEYVLDGTIIRIAPSAVLRAEAEARRLLAEEEALAGDLVVFTRTLNYARAANLAGLITESVLSPRGQVQFDDRTNTLIIGGDGKDKLDGGSGSDVIIGGDGKGDGTFAAPVTYAIGDFTRSITAADVDGDGRVPLV